jgi:hypothetical protein
VLSLVEQIEDENLLELLKADIKFFKEGDITDGLSESEVEELENFANEPDDVNLISQEEFKQLTDKWRSK